MKHVIHKLSIWWFATMVPEYTPLETIGERETLRKRRILSIIAFMGSLLVLPTLLLGILLRVSGIQFGIICSLVATMLLTVWINQRGYLLRAGLFYLSFTFLLEALFISNEAHAIPILSFCLWPVLLISLITVGFFLPPWGTLLLGISSTLYLNWFMLIKQSQLILRYIPDPNTRIVVVAFSCLIIMSIAIFSAIFTYTTNQAVIRADRATELEQTHQELAKAYRDMGITNAKLEQALTKIQKQALTDALTDLPNHRAVMDQLTKEIDQTRRSGDPFSLLFFDADHFKQVNDTYGHAVGDSILRQIGERASSILRSRDTLGRFGGEEFVLLLPETDTKQASIIAERVRVAIGAVAMATSQTENGIMMTASIGIATYQFDDMTEQELLAQADEAMYIAKRQGRNQVWMAEQAQQPETKEKITTYLPLERNDEHTRQNANWHTSQFPEKVFSQI
jgi:diguanylate cyclase (GGDEF)-like protein